MLSLSAPYRLAIVHFALAGALTSALAGCSADSSLFGRNPDGGEGQGGDSVSQGGGVATGGDAPTGGAGPGCGDGVCGAGETCTTCSDDCGVCPVTCGDATCQQNENCNNCPSDCGVCPASCGDDECQGNESCGNCPADCGVCPPSCGDDQCQGNETCSSCPADCGTCGNCAHALCTTGSKLDADCDPCVQSICQGDPYCCETAWDTSCVSAVDTVCGNQCPSCGDGSCNGNETCNSCASDCGPCNETCGNGFCALGESCSSCPADCGSCNNCSHSPCVIGAKLDAGCSDCTQTVCQSSPTCCTTTWDANCQLFAMLLCTC